MLRARVKGGWGEDGVKRGLGGQGFKGCWGQGLRGSERLRDKEEGVKRVLNWG